MSDNRRQAFRCATAQGDARALLRISEGEVVVRIVDESAGGFGVKSEQELVICEGELAGLTTSSGQSICRVTRVEFDDSGATSVGLQRVSEIAEEPRLAGNRALFTRWFGRSVRSAVGLLAFGVGLGAMVGLTRLGSFSWAGASQASLLRPDIPRDPGQRLAALSKSFSSLDELTSRQFVKALKMTDHQQRKIDHVVETLMDHLASVAIDHKDQSPDSSSHLGLLMIRRAWMQVEGILTVDQMTKWNSILDGEPSLPGSDQAGLR